MVHLRRKTIAGRLYLVSGLGIVSVLALATGSVYFAEGTRRAADSLYSRGIVRAAQTSQIELLLERHRRMIASAPLEFDRVQLIKDTRGADNLESRIKLLVNMAKENFEPRVHEKLPLLWEYGDEVMRLASNFAQEEALAVEKKYVEQAEQIQDMIRAHREARVASASIEAQELSERARTLEQWVIGIALLAALLIGPLSIFLLHSMMLRLARVTGAMRQLATHDTSVEIEEMASNDEIGVMARAVSVFKQNELQLQQLNRWLDIALNNMARGISMYDASQRLVICNSIYQRLYDMPDELVQPGASFSDVLQSREGLVEGVEGPDGYSGHDAVGALQKLIGLRREASLRQRMKDGRVLEVSVKPLPWGGWVAIHEDVTERLYAADKITRLARQDTLTGLANRFHFREGLADAIRQIDAGHSFALVAIDLDRFKEVNDSLGHPAGDALLTIVGRRLMELARRSDMVARLGGDEFAIIQRDVADQAGAEVLASRIIKALHEPMMVLGKRVEIGGTVGIALAPADATSAEDLMRKADIALYKAKTEGRGTWQFYDADIESRLKARRQMEIDLGEAVELDQFELVYQPIISLGKQRVEGCEALLRWRHPEQGMISPADFIPVAEETGLISEIGAWALKEACRAAATWPNDMFVSVNLSVAQFSGPDLAFITENALDDSGLAASRLMLEVTETLLLSEEPGAFELLRRLHDLGVSVALDDFGTGYSSLSHLQRFPFDKLKIDQSFVRELPKRSNSVAIVEAIARMAASLKMTTVAEGVETVEHLEQVEAAGCDSVQGYFFSRPVPPGDVAKVVRDIDERLATGRVLVA